MYENSDKIDLNEGDIALVIGDEIAVHVNGLDPEGTPSNGLMFIAGVVGRMKTDKAFVQEQIDWATDRILETKDDSKH